MTSVIIDDILPRTQAVATGGQTVYSTNWTANYSTDVDVYSRAANTAADDSTQQLDSSQFTVAFIGGSLTVQVTLVTPSTAGDIVTIVRNTPSDRENLYTNTNFVPSMLNNDFGILTLVDQQAQLFDEQIAPHYNYSAIIEPVVDTILPVLAANEGWAKNSSNTAIIAITPLTASDVAGVDFIVGTANSLVPDAQALGNLTTGVMFNNVSTGTGTISIVPFDYFANAPANSNIQSMSGLIGPIEQPTFIGDTAGQPVLSFNYYNGIVTDHIQVFNGINSASGFRVQSSNSDASVGIFGKGSGGVQVGSEDATNTPFAISSQGDKFYFYIPTWTTSHTLTFPDADVTLVSGTMLSNHLLGGHIFVGNVSNVATDVAMSGDGTLDDTGALTISKIGGKAVSLGGALTTGGAVTFTGAHTFNGILSADTNVTFPTSGVLLNNALTSADFFVGNGSNIATGVAMSGDATLANTGAVTVGSIGGKAVSLGGTFTMSGAHNFIGVLTGDTNVTFPTTGMLATSSDLTAYLPLAGGTMSGSLYLAHDPVLSSEAATKAYVDNVIAGVQMACLCATDSDMLTWTYDNGTAGVGATLTAPLNGASTFDDITPVDGNRVLVLFQTTNPAWQGPYTIVQGTIISPTVLTRATDWDQASEMNPGDQFAVVEGTTYGASQWMFSQVNPITVGTTALTFNQVAGQGALLKANNLSDLPSAVTARSNLGVAIGTDVQAYDAALQSISGLTTIANNMIYTTALDTYAVIAPANSSVMVSSAGGVPSWSTTLPSGLTIPGYQATLTPAALTKTDDTNVTLTLGGTPTTALLQATSLTLGWTGQLSVPRGGTGDSSFTAYSVLCGGTTSTGALQNVSGVGTAAQVLTSNGAGALPSWQSITASGVVSAGTQNQLAWYAANGSTVSGLNTANNGVLVTSSGGVPSISTTLPSGLTIAHPIINAIYGTNGFPVVAFADAASTTDYLSITSGAANALTLQITSSNSNASGSFLAKGSGGWVIGSSGATTTPMALTNGTNTFAFTIPSLTGNRTLTFPDVDVTLAPVYAATQFLTNGTFTTPANSSTLTVYKYRMVGAGGGGGSGITNTGATSGGGGSGAYAEGTFTGVAANTAITITVSNTGGTGGTAGGTGGTGGSSTIGSPVSVTCTGGVGGPGNSVAATTINGGAGGTVSAGSPNIISMPGAVGGISYPNTSVQSGKGANSPLGLGGNGGATSVGSVGVDGVGFGAGGGGGLRTSITGLGGAGAPGIILIERMTI